jgi:hypothetical protein
MSAPLSAPTGLSGGAGLPVVNQALEPASVRNGSPARQQTYARALDFEQMLVQQLSKSLTAASGLGEEGEEATEGGTGLEASGSSSEGSSGSIAPGAMGGGLSSLLPEALSNGVMSQGGLGLASQLMGDLEPAGTATAAKSVSATGGVSS